jgi:hypothetical protein
MIASIEGSGLDVEDEEYEHNASRRRLKSSSGVHDVLLTNNLVFPVMISCAYLFVSGKRFRNVCRASGLAIGWKMAAGRSCNVKIGERMLYGSFRSCRAMACVTVNEAVGAQRPRKAS